MKCKCEGCSELKGCVYERIENLVWRVNVMRKALEYYRQPSTWELIAVEERKGSSRPFHPDSGRKASDALRDLADV